jgi:hypothetical protein
MDSRSSTGAAQNTAMTRTARSGDRPSDRLSIRWQITSTRGVGMLVLVGLLLIPGRQPTQVVQPGEVSRCRPTPEPLAVFAGRSQVWRRGPRARRGTCPWSSRGLPAGRRNATRGGAGATPPRTAWPHEAKRQVDGVRTPRLTKERAQPGSRSGAQGTASTPHETCPESCPELGNSDLR